MILVEVIKRLIYWRQVDRVGPDIPLTHWRLHFKTTADKLCKRKFAKFGKHSEFRPGSFAVTCSRIEIGDHVVIRPGCYLFADPSDAGGKIVIGDHVLIGSGVHFYTTNHAFSNTQIPIFFQGFPDRTTLDSINIGNGSWIGANCVILAGVEIGENSVVGAGSVVTKSFPPRVVIGGNPAKVIKQIGD